MDKIIHTNEIVNEQAIREVLVGAKVTDLDFCDGIDMPEVDENDKLDQEEINRINRLLDGLPPNEAEVVRMNVVDELSFVEISRLLGIPQTTIKSRFYSGMRKLKQKYFDTNL